MKKTTVYDCSLIELPKINNRAGNITPIHGSENLPFEINWVYYLYDVWVGEICGRQAYKELKELMYCKLVLMWRQMENFSTNALALVLASATYSEDDYIHDYEKFKKQV